MSEAPIFPLPAPALAGGSPLYTTGEESIRLTVFNAAAGVTVALSGRFLPVRQRDDDNEPRVQEFASPLVPTTTRAASVYTQALGEGWLLDGQVVVTAGAPPTGQCYAIVELVRGQQGAIQIATVLGQGYVTAKQRLPIAAGRHQGFLEGGGALRVIQGTQPGAGLELSESVPTGARWALLAFEADLVTAVAVANRVPQLTIDDGAIVFARVSVNQSETASQTWRNSFQLGVPQSADLTRFVLTTPLGTNLSLPAGARIRTVTAGIQAADQWNAPVYLVLEWIEGS